MKKLTGIPAPTPLHYVVCYAVWVCLSAASVFLALQVWMNVVRQPLPFSGLYYGLIGTINQVSLLVLAVVTLIAILVMEHVLRIGMMRRRFWPRVLGIAIIQAAILALSYAVNFVLMRVFVPA